MNFGKILNSYGFIVVLVTVFTISASIQTSFADEKYLVYKDATFSGLFLEYPDSWNPIKSDNFSFPGVVVFDLEDDKKIATVGVMHLQLDGESNPIDISNNFLDGMKQDDNLFGIHYEGDRTVADYKSREVLVSYLNSHGYLVKQHLVFSVVEHNAYVFILTSFSDDYTKYQPSFDKFLNSIEFTPETIPELIENEYEDSKVKAKFPFEWLTMKMIGYDDKMNGPINSVISFPPEMTGAGIEKAATISLGHMDLASTPSYLEALEESNCFLASKNVSIIELNGMKMLEMETTCTVDGFDDEVDAVGYSILSEETQFILIYVAHEKQYDKNFPKFEEFLNSVEIENTINLSNYHESASAYGMTVKQELLEVTDNFSLPVVLYDNSIIQDFVFDSKNEQLSFQPILNSDGFFQIDIEIDGFLEPQYTIDVIGEDVDYFIISDKTINKTIISVFAESPTESVTVKGNLHKNFQDIDMGEISIPIWIKSNAEFWANGQIDDATFVSGIQFLIKNEIINVPVIPETNPTTSNEIPKWIKSNAEFWSQGLISDNDFLSGIEYLVKKGIIQI